MTAAEKLSETQIGEASAFTLELPPYRRPNITRIIYTSLIDRTIFVLWRVIVVAAPAGTVIWILGSIDVGGASPGIRRTFLIPWVSQSDWTG